MENLKKIETILLYFHFKKCFIEVEVKKIKLLLENFGNINNKKMIIKMQFNFNLLPLYFNMKKKYKYYFFKGFLIGIYYEIMFGKKKFRVFNI